MSYTLVERCVPAFAGMTAGGRSAADALDVGAAVAELFFQPFEPAIEVVDAVDGGFAAGGEAGDDERDRSAEVGGHDLRALELRDAFDRGDLAVDANVGTEARELGDVHVAV